VTDTPAIKIVLEQRLAELEQRAIRIEAEMTTPMNADSEEQATEAADDAALATEDAMITREIVAVIAAIARIDAGHYGKCATCGADIPPARLAAMPEARLCMECATT
jgi:RNA polymerase-binding transcription factor DksA